MKDSCVVYYVESWHHLVDPFCLLITVICWHFHFFNWHFYLIKARRPGLNVSLGDSFGKIGQ